jgi:hypothetical protein
LGIVKDQVSLPFVKSQCGERTSGALHVAVDVLIWTQLSKGTGFFLQLLPWRYELTFPHPQACLIVTSRSNDCFQSSNDTESLFFWIINDYLSVTSHILAFPGKFTFTI